MSIVIEMQLMNCEFSEKVSEYFSSRVYSLIPERIQSSKQYHWVFKTSTGTSTATAVVELMSRKMKGVKTIWKEPIWTIRKACSIVCEVDFQQHLVVTIYGLSRVHSEIFAEMIRWWESPQPCMQVVPWIKRTTLAGCRKQMRGRRLSAVLGTPIWCWTRERRREPVL